MKNFKIEKRISEGAFGTVYQAANLQHSETNNKIPSTVAIKQVYTSSTNLQRQLKILQRLPKHDNIVKIYETFNQNFMTSIIMERGKYDLSHWINQINYPVPQNTIKSIAFQVLSGLKVVHESNVIHRDLKPSNLVIKDDNSIALCDFGSAVQCSKGDEYEIEGFTRWYKCPEMLFGFRKYRFQVDIWSLGCILMEVAAGQPLFNSKSEIEQIGMVAQFIGDPSPQNWKSVVDMPDYNKINFKKMASKTEEEICEEWNISPDVCKFIMKMVRYENRPSAAQLLKDDFFKDIKLPDQQFDTLGHPLKKRQNELLEIARKMKK